MFIHILDLFLVPIAEPVSPSHGLDDRAIKKSIFFSSLSIGDHLMNDSSLRQVPKFLSEAWPIGLECISFVKNPNPAINRYCVNFWVKGNPKKEPDFNMEVMQVMIIALTVAKSVDDPNLIKLLDAMRETDDSDIIAHARDLYIQISNASKVYRLQDELRAATALSERRLLGLSCLISTTLVMAFFSFSFGLLELSGEYRTAYSYFGITATLVTTLGIAWIVDWFLGHRWGKKK